MVRVHLLTLACVSASLAMASAAALAQSASSPAGVRIRLDAASGELRAELEPSRESGKSLKIPPIRVDGALQSGLIPKEDGAANDRVRVEFEAVSDRAAAIVWTALDGAVHDFEIAMEDNSGYYGCGERFGSLNHKGLILPMASIDRPEDKGSVSYKPVPFFMSTRGYAAWLDSAAPGVFDLNATDREHVLLRFRASRLRLVLIGGADFVGFLNEFTRLSGRPRVPPAWAFAPWKSRNVHHNREELLADAELTRRHDLPGSVIVIDSPWETSYNNFELNTTQFTDPEAMFARVRQLGFYPIFWLTPFINIENVTDMSGIGPGPSSNYAEAVERGFLVKLPNGEPMIASWWKGRGGLVDFSNPAAVAWWHAQLERTTRWGARGFKCDDGEGNFVLDAVFHDGSPASEMKNRYARLYLESTQAFLDSRLGGDGVLLARCGFTGTQAQPFCWAGDNEASFSFENGLPTVVLAGQNAALSGLPFWGHDIAGYIGRPDKELFIRWTQFGAFSPLMMVHMTSNLGPWDFDEETLVIYRAFAKLHTRLFPYVQEAARAAAETGMPIIRPMVLAFPADAEAARHRYQYMFGPDLLVAPMIQPGTHRAVYLPQCIDGANWIDWWTGAAHAGGRTIEVHAPLSQMPLFVRGGAIIPLLPDDVDTLIERGAHPELSPPIEGEVVTLDSRRVLQVWPGPDRALRTVDGLVAATHREGGSTILTLASSPSRSIEIQRPYAMHGADEWQSEVGSQMLRRTMLCGGASIKLRWTSSD